MTKNYIVFQMSSQIVPEIDLGRFLTINAKK